jgi:ABC-type Fe3+ transport system permease subunit
LTCPNCGSGNVTSYQVAHESGKGSGVIYVGGRAIGTSYSTQLSDDTAPPKPPGGSRQWLWGCGILFLAPLVAQGVLMIGLAVINSFPKKHLAHGIHVVHKSHTSTPAVVVMLISLAAAAAIVVLGILLYRRSKRRRELERKHGYEPALKAWLRSYACRTCNRRFQA